MVSLGALLRKRERPPQPALRLRRAPAQALLGALVRAPEQSFVAADLVDERRIRVATAPLNLIHADRLDAQEIPVGHPPQHRVFYRAKHTVPCRAEEGSRRRPREPLCRPDHEPAVTGREVLLPFAPWHTLNRHAALRAVDHEGKENGQVENLSPRGAAHALPNRTDCAPFCALLTSVVEIGLKDSRP